jgi:hypothetical protein
MMGNTELLEKKCKWVKMVITAEELKNKFFLVKDDRKDCVAFGSRVGQNGVLRGNMGVG